MFCRKCGKQIPDDSFFCPYCGNKVIIADMSEEEKIETCDNENSSNIFKTPFEYENKSDALDIVPQKAEEDILPSNQHIATDDEAKDDESSSGIGGCLGFLCLVILTAMTKACGKAVIDNGGDSFSWLVIALAGIVGGLVPSAIPIWVASKYKMCGNNVKIAIAVMFGAIGLWGGILTALPIALILSVFFAFFGKKAAERNKKS